MSNGIENDTLGIVWEEQEDATGGNGGVFVEGQGANATYYALLNNFGWTNVDRFYSDPNPKTRYFSGVSAGLTYTIAAIFAGIFSSLYLAFPIELTMILAGLALFPVILNSLVVSLEDKNFRESAVVTFLVTISGVSGWGIGAPFWGLLAGLAVHRIIERSA